MNRELASKPETMRRAVMILPIASSLLARVRHDSASARPDSRPCPDLLPRPDPLPGVTPALEGQAQPPFPGASAGDYPPHPTALGHFASASEGLRLRHLNPRATGAIRAASS